jgi:hypothetical protein
MRVNYHNIMVISYSDSENTIYDFENIPFEHKKIITSRSDITTPSSVLIHKESSMNLAEAFNWTAIGKNNILDIIALSNNEKNYLRER